MSDFKRGAQIAELVDPHGGRMTRLVGLRIFKFRLRGMQLCIELRGIEFRQR
ncbi:MAG: hypothetical protein JWL62_434, partial [Hyphomicrobiales bacterium]|nr:hypothetical protein [Hyphomicrobiales bacterium]